MNELHIAYAADHNFALICAISVASLLENINSTDFYYVHILSDGSMDDIDRRRFDDLEKSQSNVEIKVHDLKIEQFDSLDFSNTYLTKMTMYRLLLARVLPEADACVYLDSDTIVCSDIAQITEYDLTDYYLGAVWDSDIEKIGYENPANLDLTKYFNGGVLYMNLKKIREDKLEEQFFELAKTEWPFRDQEVLNIACQGKVLFMDEKYNRFSYKVKPDEIPAVVHYVGREMRPWNYIRTNFADTWWSTAERFADDPRYLELKASADEFYQNGSFSYIKEQCNKHEHVYIFGSGISGRNMKKSLSVNRILVTAFIDNNDSAQGKNVSGIPVISSKEIEAAEDAFYIICILSAAGRREVQKQLLDLGILDENILPYEERTPEFYYYMDPKYLPEEKEEVFIKEYGSGAERIGWK